MQFRNQQFSIPMYVRTQIQGLEPRTIQVGPLVVPADMKADVILIDAKCLVGTKVNAGEQFQGLVKVGKLNIDGTTRLSFKRDCLEPLALGLAMLEGLPRQNDSIAVLYEDDFDLETRDAHVYYMLVGPFQPGTYYLTLEFNRVTDEFKDATDFTADIGLKVDISPIEQGDRFLEAESDQKFSANETVLADIDGGVLFSEGKVNTNIDTVTIDGVSLSPVAYESFWRTWIQHFANAWNATQRTDDLGWVFVKRRTIEFKFNTATSIDWMTFRLYGGLPTRPPPWVPAGQGTIQGKPPVSLPPTGAPPVSQPPAGPSFQPRVMGGGFPMRAFERGERARTIPEQRELDPSRVLGAL